MSQPVIVEALPSAPLKVVAKLGFLKLDGLGRDKGDGLPPKRSARRSGSGTPRRATPSSSPRTRERCPSGGQDGPIIVTPRPPARKPKLNPPWELDDFCEVMMRKIPTDGSEYKRTRAADLDIAEQRLIRWVVMSSRLLSGDSRVIRLCLIL
jgi:hypothetical protein